MNLYTKYRDIENKVTVTRGDWEGGRNKLEVWG